MEKNIKYMITTEKKCPNCDGNRYVIHPAWQKYSDESYTKKISMKEFFAEYGGEIPPEEIICKECNGEGIKQEIVELTKEILLAILNSKINELNKPSFSLIRCKCGTK